MNGCIFVMFIKVLNFAVVASAHFVQKKKTMTNMMNSTESKMDNIVLLIVLAEIQDMCIGKITMNASMDAEYIGQRISHATGMTKPQLDQYILENEEDYPGF